MESPETQLSPLSPVTRDSYTKKEEYDNYAIPRLDQSDSSEEKGSTTDSDPYVHSEILVYLFFLGPLLFVFLFTFAFAITVHVRGQISAPPWITDLTTSYPRYTAQLVAILASAFTATTRWVLGGSAALLSRKRVANSPRQIMEIDVFSNLKNISVIWDWKHRRWMMLLTWFMVAVCGLLTSGFVALFSPLPIPITTPLPLVGKELNIATDRLECMDWHTRLMRQLRGESGSGCTRELRYNGFIYSSCTTAGALPELINAAKAAVSLHFASTASSSAQSNFVSSFTRLNNTRILGSSAGTLLTGPRGLQVFPYPPPSERTENFNYSLSLQGSWADVSCRYDQNSFLAIEFTAETTTQYQHSIACPGQATPRQIVIPKDYLENGYMISSVCDNGNPDTTSILFRSYRNPTKSVGDAMDYMTCDVGFKLGDVDAVLDADIGAFRLRKKTPLSGSKPALAVEVIETAKDAIGSALASAQTEWTGNLIETQISSLSRAYGAGWKEPSDMALQLVALSIGGMFEYQVTAYRLMLEATAKNFANLTIPDQCLRDVQGVMTERIVGWDIQRLTIVGLMPVLVICLISFGILAWTVTAVGRLTKFDPTSPVSLIASTAAGGVKFATGSAAISNSEEESVLKTRVQYEPVTASKWGLKSY